MGYRNKCLTWNWQHDWVTGEGDIEGENNSWNIYQKVKPDHREDKTLQFTDVLKSNSKDEDNSCSVSFLFVYRGQVMCLLYMSD